MTRRSNNLSNSSSLRWTFAAFTAAAVLAACGGGGGDGRPAPATGATAVDAPTQISGAVVKGPVSGSAVCAYELVSTGKGRQLGCTTSATDGAYSLAIDYAGPVVVEATGGTYTDEASGTPGVALDVPLAVAGSVARGTQTLVATPLTALAYSRALRGGSLTVAGFDAAAREVGSAFIPLLSSGGVEIDIARTLPVVSGTRNPYGSALGVVSAMLGQGATLSGIIGNESLESLAHGYGITRMQICRREAGPLAVVDFPASTGTPSIPGNTAATTVTGPVTSTPTGSLTTTVMPPPVLGFSCRLMANGSPEPRSSP